VPPDHGCDGETVSPSLHFSSQTSAGKPTIAIGISFRRGAAAIPFQAAAVMTRLIAALLCQHGPSDPRQLVGEGGGQNVRMPERRE
jgi:hypothetical protein